MLIWIPIGVAAVIVILVIVVAMQPSKFVITRSATMNAPPGAVFEQVNELRKWQAWSPWERLDPNLNRTYEGPPAGVGAGYGWSGNKKVGEGRMTIIDSLPGELVRIRLEFLKPFKATNTSEFIFMPRGDQTEVKWNMLGENNFMGKFFCMLMNMDKMVGKDFEKGLGNLKGVVEGR